MPILEPALLTGGGRLARQITRSPRVPRAPRRPSVSIVTPCLNAVDTIGDTIASIARQTYPVEHVICDGLSVDGTVELVRERAPGAVLSTRRDGGLYEAMNRGIGMCRGDIIGILNADDHYCHAYAIERVIRTFERHPEVDIVYGGIQYVDSAASAKVTRRWRPGLPTRMAWRQGWMPPHPAVFVRARLYADLGTYRTCLSLSSDYEFLLRAMYFAGRRATYLDDILVNMRSGGLSNATLANRLKANKQDRDAWKLNDASPPLALGLIKPLRKLHQWRWFRRPLLA